MVVTANAQLQQLVRDQLMELLGNAFSSGRKDISPSTPSLPYYLGHGGDNIFGSLSGVNKEFISTIQQAEGLAGAIPAFGSMFDKPEFGYITGFGVTTGEDPSGICADAKQPGAVITCLQTAHFGRYRMDTRPIAITDVGRQRNYADPMDLRVMNMPLMPNIGGLTPDSAYDPGSAMMNPTGEVPARMGEVAREITQTLMQKFWFATPSYPLGGGTEDFIGLDTLIGTTKVDSRTGEICSTLRSDIKPFGYRNVNDNGGRTILTAIMNIVWTRKQIARRSNMGMVRWAFVMRENLFRELSAIWPCAYNTSGCIGMSTDTFTLSMLAKDNINDRDNMRAGKYLMVDGEQIPVIFDDAIPEEDRGDGCWASDMFFVPFSVKGGIPVLYWEYLNYNQGGMLAARQSKYNQFWTDNGRYLWWNKPNNNVCIQLGMVTEPRVVFLTPHLAGKLTDIEYCALQHAPDPFRGDLYFPTEVGHEGVRTRTGLYSDASPTTLV